MSNLSDRNRSPRYPAPQRPDQFNWLAIARGAVLLSIALFIVFEILHNWVIGSPIYMLRLIVEILFLIVVMLHYD